MTGEHEAPELGQIPESSAKERIGGVMSRLWEVDPETRQKTWRGLTHSQMGATYQGEETNLARVWVEAIEEHHEGQSFAGFLEAMQETDPATAADSRTFYEPTLLNLLQSDLEFTDANPNQALFTPEERRAIRDYFEARGKDLPEALAKRYDKLREDLAGLAGETEAEMEPAGAEAAADPAAKLMAELGLDETAHKDVLRAVRLYAGLEVIGQLPNRDARSIGRDLDNLLASPATWEEKAAVVDRLQTWLVKAEAREAFQRGSRAGRTAGPPGMARMEIPREQELARFEELVEKGGVEAEGKEKVLEEIARLRQLDPDLTDPQVWQDIQDLKRRVMLGEELQLDPAEVARAGHEEAEFAATLQQLEQQGRFSYREMAFNEIKALVLQLGDEERAYREWTIQKLKELSASGASSKDAGNYETMGKLAGIMGSLPEKYAYLRDLYLSWVPWNDFLGAHKDSGSAEDAFRLSYIVDGQKLARIMAYSESHEVRIRKADGSLEHQSLGIDIADFLDEYDKEEWSSIEQAAQGEKWGKMVTKDGDVLSERRKQLRIKVLRDKLGLAADDTVVGINGKEATFDDLLEETGWAENFAQGFYDAWRISYWDVLFNGRTKDWLGKIDRFPRYCHMYGISAGNLRDRADLGMRVFFEYASGDLLMKPYVETVIGRLPQSQQEKARAIFRSKIFTQKEINGWMKSWGQIADQDWTKEESQAVAAADWGEQLDKIGVDTSRLNKAQLKGKAGFELFFQNMSYRHLRYSDLIPDKVGKCYGYIKDANATRVMMLNGLEGVLLLPIRTNIEKLTAGYSWMDRITKAKTITRMIGGVHGLRSRKWLGNLEIVVEESPNKESRQKPINKAKKGEVVARNAGVVLDQEGDVVYDTVPLSLWSSTAMRMGDNVEGVLSAVNIPRQRQMGVRDYGWMTLGLRNGDLGCYGRRYYWPMVTTAAVDALAENLTKQGLWDRRTAEALKDTLLGSPPKRFIIEKIIGTGWSDFPNDLLDEIFRGIT